MQSIANEFCAKIEHRFKLAEKCCKITKLPGGGGQEKYAKNIYSAKVQAKEWIKSCLPNRKVPVDCYNYKLLDRSKYSAWWWWWYKWNKNWWNLEMFVVVVHVCVCEFLARSLQRIIPKAERQLWINNIRYDIQNHHSRHCNAKFECKTSANRKPMHTYGI